MPNWIAPTSGFWNNAANWSGGIPNAVAASASFSLGSGGAALDVFIPGSTNITLGTLNVLLSGTRDLVIQGSGGGASNLIFDGGGVAANIIILTTAGNGDFTLSGAGGLQAQFNGQVNVNVINSGSTALFSLPISSTSGGILLKQGAGTLVLSGPVSLPLSIQEGILQATDAGSFEPGYISFLDSTTAAFRSNGVLDETFIIADVTGRLLAAAGATLELTGNLAIVYDSTVRFGSATDTGTIVANFSSIGNAALGNIDTANVILAGGTLRIGNQGVAAFQNGSYGLFDHPNAVRTQIFTGATLDTGGFLTTIRNLDLNGGAIRSSTGNLRVTVHAATAYTQTGIIEGTAGEDRLIINTTGGFTLDDTSFANWTASDLIQIVGNNANNALTGSSQNDQFFGFGGVDVVNGGFGNDLIILSGTNDGSTVDGGAGTDTLRLTDGALTLAGVSGFEVVNLIGGATLTLTSAQFTAGLAVNSALSGTGSIIVNMSLGNQQMLSKLMTVQAGSNLFFTINGSSGADVIKVTANAVHTILGAAGTDVIQGSNLGDSINGGADIDKIAGNGGIDTMTGGTGADVFKFRSASDAGTGGNADIITDFLSGTDRLNFLRIDTNPGLAGDQAFTFVGTAAFAGGGTASIRYVDTGADLRVEADVNGDGVADMHVLLQSAGAGTLSAADFVL